MKGYHIIYFEHRNDVTSIVKLHREYSPSARFGHFSPHIICSTVTETIRVTNYITSFGATNVQKTKFEASEMTMDQKGFDTIVIFRGCSDGLVSF